MNEIKEKGRKEKGKEKKGSAQGGHEEETRRKVGDKVLTSLV